MRNRGKGREKMKPWQIRRRNRGVEVVVVVVVGWQLKKGVAVGRRGFGLGIWVCGFGNG